MKKQSAASVPEGMTRNYFQRFLHQLAISGDPRYQVAAAAHPLASEETLLALAKKATYWGSYGMGPLNELAKRKNLSDNVMLALLKNKHYPDNNFLQGEMLSPTVAMAYFRKKESLYHCSMAKSDKVPREVLCVVAREAYFSAIQEMASYSPFFNEELLDIILQRLDMEEQVVDCADETKRNWVYLALASNENIVMPESLQFRIIEDGKIFPCISHLKRLSYRKDLTQKTKEVLAKMLPSKE